jgi:hypothetical protein
MIFKIEGKFFLCAKIKKYKKKNEKWKIKKLHSKSFGNENERTFHAEA